MKHIQQAYDVTIAALENQLSCSKAERVAHLRAVEEGSADPYEYDGDEPLYRKEDLHDLLVDAAASTLPIALSAYVIVLHHFWEKSCVEWMATKKYVADDAYTWLQGQGLTVDVEQLEVLRDSANTLKHNADKLFKRRPDLFHEPSGNDLAKRNYAELLNLQKEDIVRMFKAVATSGMQAMPKARQISS